MQRANCVHHWVLPEPDGLFSFGKCKNCGAVRQFRNFLEENDYLTQTEKRFSHV